MKQIVLIFLAILSLNSCQTDDDPISCPGILLPTLFINLVDVNGQNLIESGFYNGANIVVRQNDLEFPGILDPSDANVGNFLQIGINGEQGLNEFLIELSETEIDTLTLDLNIELVDEDCNTFLPFLQEVLYNGEPIEVATFSDDFNKIITVVK